MKRRRAFALAAAVFLIFTAGIAGAEQVRGKGPARAVGPADGKTLLTRRLGGSDIRGLAGLMTDDNGDPATGFERIQREYAAALEEFRGADTRTIPFSVTLEDFSGEFTAGFLQVSDGVCCSIVPEEWDAARCLFLTDQHSAVFLACTDAGIWKLDPASRTAEKLSSDTYRGETKEELRARADLLWTGNPVVSPGGEYVVYLTNRADPFSGGNDVWALDTRTGEEHPLTDDSDGWKAIRGFLSDRDALVEWTDAAGASRYAVVDAAGGAVRDVGFPAGALALCTSSSGAAAFVTAEENTLVLARIGADGSLLSTASFPGYFPGVMKFSPAGTTLAAPVSDTPDHPASGLLLIDTADFSVRRLSPRRGQDETILNYAWANETALVVTYSGAETAWLYSLT